MLFIRLISFIIFTNLIRISAGFAKIISNGIAARKSTARLARSSLNPRIFSYLLIDFSLALYNEAMKSAMNVILINQ